MNALNSFTFRPVSSMGLSLVPEGSKNLQKLSVLTLPGYRPTSSSSLFDCPHDCFERDKHTHVEEEKEMEDLNDFARVVQQELDAALNNLDNM